MMECIVGKLQKQGVLMALFLWVLLHTGCEEHFDRSTVNPSEGEMVEVSLNIGFADEADAASLSSAPATKSNQTADKQAAFDMQLQPATQTKTATNRPDKLYNLDIHQYKIDGTHLASFTVGSIAPGTAIASTLNSNNGAECQLLIIARGATGAVASLSSKSLSQVKAIMANSSTISSVDPSNGTNINNMPYLLFLPKVKISSGGKLISPEDTDVRLLLKRLAVGLTIDWTFSDDMTRKGYSLTEVRLMQLPKDYRILPERETVAPYGEMYPTSVSEFVDGFRLKGAALTTAGGKQTLWMPANARGVRNDINSPNQRSKEKAHSAATYIEFVVDNSSKNERLLYRAYLGGNATTDFNLLENTNYHWTLNINNANYTTDNRIQLLDQTPVKSDNLQPTANCFMMRPGTNICFNPYKHEAEEDGYNNRLDGIWNPYLINNGNTIGDKKQIAKIKVLWQSKDNATSGDLVMGYAISKENHSNLVNLTDAGDINNARIHVKVANTKGGNAVVAAYNSEDVIVWSWHLWITDYVPQPRIADMTYEQAQELTRNGSVHQYPTDAFTDPSGIYYNKVTMDRNLCAGEGGFPGKDAPSIDFTKRVGYLYYWGRKDPFFGLMDGTTNEFDVLYDGDGYSISISKIAYNTIPLVNGNRMQYTIQNPSTIVIGALSWHDNNESSGAQYLYANAKTLYDPCPFGWKISAKPAYEGFNTGKAYWFSSNGEFLQSSGSDSEKGGRLYNLTGGTGAPTNITIHNTAWMPKTGYRDRNTGDLAISSGRGYLGTATMAATSSKYRCYFLRFNASSIDIVNNTGYLGESLPFRCVQK